MREMCSTDFHSEKRAILSGLSFDFRCKIELDPCAGGNHHLLQVVHEGVHGGVMLRQVLPHLCGDGGGGRDRGDGRHVRRVRQRRHAPLRRRVRLVVHRAGGRAHPRVLEIHGRVRWESLEGKRENKCLIESKHHRLSSVVHLTNRRSIWKLDK